ncbi:hypothetical protein HC928_07640 [bacterium]|nr:hypothetical protein [bacterium]
MDSITLKTNLQTYGPFGGFGGNDFTIDLPAGTEFVGFTGRSGNVVDALGLVYRDLPQLSLCSEGKTVTNPANSHQYCLSAASTWTEAQQYGQSLGGYLVTVNDSAEQDWLLSTFGSQRLYWIGYSDRDSEGNFVWASGQTPDYTNWLAGEPNNGKCFADEHYAAMNWFSAEGQWNDLNDQGYYEDCGDVSQFCGEEGQIKPGHDVTCTVGFKPLMGIVEIEAQPKAVLKGMKWNDANGNGIQDSELIQGDNPDAIFVVDISRSSLDRFKGSPVGDVNGNGNPDEILDAELAGFSALAQQLIDLGFGDTAKVGIVVFGSGGSQVDVDLATPGQQLITKAGADNNGNGIPDVKEVLASIQSYKDPYNVGPGTNYEAALQNAEATLNAIHSAPEQGNIIFLSDGEPSPQIQQNYSDEIQRINPLV